MFGWLKRLFGIGKAEMHAALDKIEDPSKMADQGIRDLKEDLTKSLQGLAEVKALSIRARKELEMNQQAATEYENKAILLLQKAQKGELVPQEADRLATQALAKKEQLEGRITAGVKNVQQYEQMVSKMEENVQKLKSQISQWESEVKILKARQTVSQATARLNKQLANLDSNDTLARLERMKSKVDEQEALAASYGDIASMNTSVDDEINKALGPSYTTGTESAALKSLKEKLALEQNASAGQNTGFNTGEGASDQNQAQGFDNPSSELEELKKKLRNIDPGS